MNYKDIETFLELVRTRNITKTAEHLYLSQSTVSKRLKNLEDELGSRLIIHSKGHRAIQLTKQGELFVPVAERWRNLFEETELIKSSSLSTLRLATSESNYYEIVAPFLRSFFSRYPHFKVAVQICDSEHIYALLDKNLIDYGFVSYEAFHPGILVQCIDCQPMCVIQHSENPTQEQIIQPKQLDPAKEIRFIGGHFNNMKIWREKWFGINQECRIEINSSRGSLLFLHDTNYWALVPLDMATHLSQELNIQIYRLEDEPDPCKIFFLKPHKNYQNNIEVRRLFEKELKSFLKEENRNPQLRR